MKKVLIQKGKKWKKKNKFDVEDWIALILLCVTVLFALLQIIRKAYNGKENKKRNVR